MQNISVLNAIFNCTLSHPHRSWYGPAENPWASHSEQTPLAGGLLTLVQWLGFTTDNQVSRVMNSCPYISKYVLPLHTYTPPPLSPLLRSSTLLGFQLLTRTPGLTGVRLFTDFATLLGVVSLPTLYCPHPEPCLSWWASFMPGPGSL